MLRYGKVLEQAKTIRRLQKEGKSVSDADLKYLEGAKKIFKNNKELL